MAYFSIHISFLIPLGFMLRASGRATSVRTLPGVDLRLTATTNGFATLLEIKTAAAVAQIAPKKLTFTINGGSLALASLPDGSITATSPDGTVQLNEASPTWWDSHDPTASAAGPGNSSVPLPLPTTVSSDSKSVTLSASAIAAAQNLTYPVYVDPSWTGGDAAWTFVDSAYPTEDYYNGENASDGYKHVGYVTAADSNDGKSHTTRSFFKMDTHAVAGKHIISAKFDTHLYYSSSCTKEPVDLYRSTDAISSSTTWNNQPSLSTRQDEQSVAYRSGCTTGGSSDGYLSVGFNATDAATYAAAHNSDTTTLALKAPNESDHSAYTWKKFGNQPRLAITYDSIPTTGGGRSVSPCLTCSGPAITSSGTPTLTGQASDADGGNLTIYYEVYSGFSASPTTLVASGSAYGREGDRTSWKVSPILNTGNYEYRVRGYDGTAFGLWSTVMAQFQVDTTAPSAPDVTITGASTTSTTSPTGTVGKAVTANFTTTTNSGTTEIVYSVYDDLPTYSSRHAPACGSSSGGIVVLCRSGSSSYPVQTIAAVDTSTVLSVVAFDAAGNVSRRPCSRFMSTLIQLGFRLAMRGFSVMPTRPPTTARVQARLPPLRCPTRRPAAQHR